MAKGIDIYSRYQAVTDWGAVKRSGVSFVYVKLTDGSGKPNGGRNPGDGQVSGAKSIGIPVGGYHYAQFSPSPEAQADIFLAEVTRLGATGLVPQLDLEDPFTPNDAAKQFAIRFCNRVASRGFRPGIYMSSSFAKTLRPDLWGIPGLVIWIASYGANNGNRNPLTGGYPGRIDIHQYTSVGRVLGITGSVDLNESLTNAHLTSSPAPEVPDMLPDENRMLRQVAVVVLGKVNPTEAVLDGPGLRSLLAQSDAKINGLVAAVAALSNDADITLEEVDRIIREAVAESVPEALADEIEITGEVRIGSKNEGGE